jgi:hypothetical protein
MNLHAQLQSFPAACNATHSTIFLGTAMRRIHFLRTSHSELRCTQGALVNFLLFPNVRIRR